MVAEPEAPAAKKLRIKLKASDNTIIEVDADVAFQCLRIKNVVQCLGITDPDDRRIQDPFPLGIDSATLIKIVEWCTENRGKDLLPIGVDEFVQGSLTNRERQWIDVPEEELLELHRAAHLLNIPRLEHITGLRLSEIESQRNTT